MWINRHNFVIISTFSVLKDQYNLMDIKTKRKEDLGKRLEKTWTIIQPEPVYVCHLQS